MENLRSTEVNLKTNSGKTRIALCIPAYGTITVNWLINFMRFIKVNSNKYDLDIHIHEEQPVSISRNALADKALAKDPEYIMWMDADNACGNETIDRLLQTMEAENADFVTALYFSKTPPYYAVLRKKKHGVYWKIENPELGKRIPIDGAGMGCCIVKADAFKKITKPYFMFSHENIGGEEVVLSEDLYFCRKLQEAGMRLIADTKIISAHIGGSVDIMEYINYSDVRLSVENEREILKQHIMDFEEIDEKEASDRIRKGPELIKEEWLKINPQTKEEIIKFYKETKLYLYDSAAWHFGNRRLFDMQLVSGMKNQWNAFKDTIFMGRAPKVLDFGCGIGQNAIMLAEAGFDVTLADLESDTLRFAEYRFKKQGIPYKVWKTEEEPPKEKYDFILAFDVFEHMVDEDVLKYTEMLKEMKHENTQVKISVAFGKDVGGKNSHPMHFDATPQKMEAIKKLVYGKPE